MGSIKHCQLNLLFGVEEQAQDTVQKLLVLASCKLNMWCVLRRSCSLTWMRRWW